jgi:phenylpyruvate tautomerase PptA (4-oxalocrotonate tautomerase family)
MKAEIATAITDAHVEMTGAPRVFVHLFFSELPPGVAYSAGELDNKISGRAKRGDPHRTARGRQAEADQEISESWSAITG